MIGVGTEKGAFFIRSKGGGWVIEGPRLPGWRVTTFGTGPGGAHLLATGSNWFGAAIHTSDDLVSWRQIVDGPKWPDGGERRLNSVWTIESQGDVLFAGVDEAGLFRSDDGGESWEPIDGLNELPSRDRWHPGFGGLAAHRVVVDPTDVRRIWVGISAVGAFRTTDGGASWVSVNDGVPKTAADDEVDDIGFCVHSLVIDPDDSDKLWRQDHQGVFRTSDGGDHWERIEDGLPAGFGFPLVRDPGTGNLFVVPQQSDEHRLPVDGRFRVYRSTDGGDSWHESGTGQPDHPLYAGVLRDAMAVDGRGGVFVGSTAGTLHASRDAGDTWETIPAVLPRILSVKVMGA